MAGAPAMLELDRIDTYRGPAQILRGVSRGGFGSGNVPVRFGRDGSSSAGGT